MTTFEAFAFLCLPKLIVFVDRNSADVTDDVIDGKSDDPKKKFVKFQCPHCNVRTPTLKVSCAVFSRADK